MITCFNDYGFGTMQLPLTFSALQTKSDTCVNGVDPDETARNEPSHQDLQCLQLYCFFFLSLTETFICNSGHVQFKR